MSIKRLLHQIVTVQTIVDSVADRYGVAVDAVSGSVEVAARLEQTESTEVSVGESTIVSDWRAFLPSEVSVTHRDRLVDAYDRTFEVVGAPDTKETPRGPHHLSVRLRFVK